MPSNIPLLRDIVEETKFRAGSITTKYLLEIYPEGFTGAALGPAEERELLAIAAVLQARLTARARQFLHDTRSQQNVNRVVFSDTLAESLLDAVSCPSRAPTAECITARKASPRNLRPI